MAEKFKMGDLDIQVYEAHRSPKSFNSTRFSPKNIIIRLFNSRTKSTF